MRNIVSVTHTNIFGDEDICAMIDRCWFISRGKGFGDNREANTVAAE